VAGEGVDNISADRTLHGIYYLIPTGGFLAARRDPLQRVVGGGGGRRGPGLHFAPDGAAVVVVFVGSSSIGVNRSGGVKSSLGA
jgi:hypothetical protein